MNGRWIKSQRAVTFPREGLDPLRYTVKNGNGSSGVDTPLSTNSRVATPPSPRSETAGGDRVSPVAVPEACLGVAMTPGGSGLANGIVEEDGEEGNAAESANGDASRSSPPNNTAESANGDAGRSSPPNNTAESANGDARSSPPDLPNLPKLYNLFAICVSQERSETVRVLWP